MADLVGGGKVDPFCAPEPWGGSITSLCVSVGASGP